MDIQKNFQQAHTIYTVGPQKPSVRPISKIIATCMKAGILIALGTTSWKAYEYVTSPHIPSADTTKKTVLQPHSTFQKLKLSETDSLPPPNGSLPSVSPKEESVVPISTTDTIPSLTVKLWKANKKFQAAVLQIEGIEQKPYYIEGKSTHPTIGVGYNVQMSVNTIGQENVIREFKQAGIDSRTISLLLSKEHTISSQARISIPQALSLLDISSHRFKESTRAAVGQKTFDKLPLHRQISLMWIDYNSNIHERPKLIKAVQNNNVKKAIDEMDIWITIKNKKMLSPNAILAKSMFWNPQGLFLSVMNPTKLKKDAEKNIFLWEDSSTSMEQQISHTHLSSDLKQDTFLDVIEHEQEQKNQESHTPLSSSEHRKAWLNARSVTQDSEQKLSNVDKFN